MCDLHLQIPSNIVDIIRKVTRAYELLIMVVSFFSSTKIDWGHDLPNSTRKSEVMKLSCMTVPVVVEKNDYKLWE